jgi:hypothetical protein
MSTPFLPDDPLPARLMSRLEGILPDGPDAALGVNAMILACLADLEGAAGPDSPQMTPRDVARIVSHFLRLFEQDRLLLRRKMQRAQWFAQHPGPPAVKVRLEGEARALSISLAGALAETGAGKDAFDPAYYLARNPDVAQSGSDPLEHYCSSGAAEGRRPRALPQAGAQTFADLAASAPVTPSQIPPVLRIQALRLCAANPVRVSVIIPTYNRALTLRAALSTALLQSLPPFEVIVIDDGSTDQTGALLAGHDNPVVRVISGPHSGVSAARNLGLEAARGDVIAYLDSDNEWDADHLLWARTALALAPDAALATTAACLHNLSDGWSKVVHTPFDRAALEQANTMDLNAVLHPVESYRKWGGFDPDLTRLVDWDLVLRYTGQGAPGQLPVITAHTYLDRKILSNVTLTQNFADNAERILDKVRSAEKSV